MTSWDDFGDYDYQLYELLMRHRLPGIFFIPTNELKNRGKLQLAKVIARDFAIGSHTVNHPVLSHISHADMVCEVNDSKKILEDELDQEVRFFCYPKGRYNEAVKDEVRRAGYVFARTVDVLNIDPKQPDLMELKTTCHVYSGRKEYKGRKWDDIGKEYLDDVFENGGYFHLWGHGKEINRDEEWDSLSRFMGYMKERIDENLHTE